ncbi:hypothetical protein [Crassaminicella indica]|uniref:Uncharacterized protein n=1 Tax=Crassaminicella indica TaxID=2855394 RepID=A0ABX8RDR6_9CLOT|nr:hypothetical protein [Crassaminicella indica]QXM06050.1 hypothetical protein KVH43_11955 [Crassaminicella indica]
MSQKIVDNSKKIEKNILKLLIIASILLMICQILHKFENGHILLRKEIILRKGRIVWTI